MDLANRPRDKADASQRLDPSQSSGTDSVEAVDEPRAATGNGQAATGIKGPGPSSTRISRAWTGVGAAVVFLIVALVFILQNGEHVKVNFFTLHWSVPLALDLFMAAALGAIVVFLLAAVRMTQLRLFARGQRKDLDDHATAPGSRLPRRGLHRRQVKAPR